MTQDIITTAGIDASKATLDIAVHGCVERWQVVNALPGWRALATRLATAGVARVGIEATGGYERGIVRYLRAAGFTVLILQPIQVRAYARVCLRRAKNDALDAALIAACAANLDPERIAPDPRLADLVGHLSFVEQIEADIARFKTWLEHVDDRRLRRLIINNITRLKARRNAELRRIGERLRAHDDLALRLDLVLSVPGIGERTPIALIVRMPELGHVSRKQAAALAPFDDDSGKRKGQRHIAGGRGRLRRSLFAAALPAAFRWNKALIPLYPASPAAESLTMQRSSPAPESSSSTPIPSSSAKRPGPKKPPRFNGCYALRAIAQSDPIHRSGTKVPQGSKWRDRNERTALYQSGASPKLRVPGVVKWVPL